MRPSNIDFYQKISGPYELDHNCKYSFECMKGLKCIDSKCSCSSNFVYSVLLRACFNIHNGRSEIVDDNNIVIVERNLNWLEANIEMFKVNASLFYSNTFGDI